MTKKRIALCRISDIEPLLSIAQMLESAGFDCVVPNRGLRNRLRDLGCRNVDEFEDMHKRWGCEMPPIVPHIRRAEMEVPRFPEVGLEALETCDLFVDVNGCRNGPLAWAEWPRLRGRVLTYFINGGDPRDTWDKGDNVTPVCPIVTTAQHYRATLTCTNTHPNKENFCCDDPPREGGYWTNDKFKGPSPVFSDVRVGSGKQQWLCPWGCGPMRPAPWLGRVYVHHPPFTRQDRVLRRYDGTSERWDNPVSFVHNTMGWGCGHLVDEARAMGVRVYGGGSSPDGLVPHERVFGILQSALCTVYLKGGGAVDYSILEPMSCGCPTTFHETYRHNTRLYELLVPGETCLEWSDIPSMRACVDRLRDPTENRRIGEAGRNRMRDLCWTDENPRDRDGFRDFLVLNFPDVMS